MKLLLEICCFAVFCVFALDAYANYTQSKVLQTKLDKFYTVFNGKMDSWQEVAEAKLEKQRVKYDL